MRSITKRRWRASSALSRLIPTAPLLTGALPMPSGLSSNKPWEAFQPQAKRRQQLPRPMRPSSRPSAAPGPATGPERALIAALGYRYPDDRPSGDNASWNRGYAGAMRAAYRDYPDDLDVAVLFADALMNLTPWQLWDTATGKPADGAATIEIRDILDRVLTSPPAGRTSAPCICIST